MKGEKLKVCIVRPPKSSQRAPPSSSTGILTTSSEPLRHTEVVKRCISMVQFLGMRGEQGGYMLDDSPESEAFSSTGITIHGRDPETTVREMEEPRPPIYLHHAHWDASGGAGVGRKALMHIQRRMANLTISNCDVLTKASSSGMVRSDACHQEILDGCGNNTDGGGGLSCDSYDCVVPEDGIEGHVLVSPPRPSADCLASENIQAVRGRGGEGNHDRSTSGELDAEYVVVPR